MNEATQQAIVDRLSPIADVLAEVGEGARVLDDKWGEQNHPDGTGSEVDKRMALGMRFACQRAFAGPDGTWRDVLIEEVYEAFAESDPAKLREELRQVAAVAVNWIQAIDRRPVPKPLLVSWCDDDLANCTLKVRTWGTVSPALRAAPVARPAVRVIRHRGRGLIRVIIELPNEDPLVLDIVNTGQRHGYPQGDGIYDMDPEGPPIPNYFGYKVRSSKGTRYFSHNTTRGWKNCVEEALRVMA